MSQKWVQRKYTPCLFLRKDMSVYTEQIEETNLSTVKYFLEVISLYF